MSLGSRKTEFAFSKRQIATHEKMTVLALTFALLAHFIAVGRAALIAVGYQGSPVRAWLLSPSIGVAFQIIVTTILNQWGFPVTSFAKLEFIISTLLALGILLWRRPALPIRLVGPFFIVSLLSVCYTGWPALVIGPGWVSYANDDMANYCLGALRHLNHGFFDVPTATELAGTDYSQYYWFLYVGRLIRFGSDILLAWSAGWSGLNPLKVFMPTTLALSAGMLSATGLLALAGRCRYRVALGANVILSVSPLFLFGIYYQLIAQVCGLALVFSICAVMCDRRIGSNRSSFRPRTLACGVLGAALCVTYPEITPFAILSYCLLFGISVVLRRKIGWAAAGLPLAVIVAVGIILRYNLFTYANTVLLQSSAATAEKTHVFLFPYFLVPSGLANLFGLLPIAGVYLEPFNSMVIILGGLFLFLTIAGIVKAAWSGTFYGCVLVVMLSLGFLLFQRNADFGLFKLAMFCQPPLAIVIALFSLNDQRWSRWCLLGVYCAAQIPTSWHYASASLGDKRGGFNTLPGISRADIKIEFPAGDEAVTSGIDHIVAAKFAAVQSRGRLLHWVSRDFFASYGSAFSDSAIPWARKLFEKFYPHANEILSIPELWSARDKASIKARTLFGSKFYLPSQAATAPPTLSMPLQLNIFNHFSSEIKHPDRFYTLATTPASHPEVFFVNSSRGEHYYLPKNLATIGINQIEADYYSPGRQMAGIGRFMLLQVYPAEKEIYLRIALTRSLMGSGRTILMSTAKVLSQNKMSLPLVGAGAVNLIVGPIVPVAIEGNFYVAIDLGEDGRPFLPPRTGAMRLYNTNLPLDPRLVVAFGRDVSALSTREYTAIERPHFVSRFPTDIAEARTLEFSGWFEDGWISQRSYVVLAGFAAGERLRVQGLVPGIGRLLPAGQHLEVTVNGRFAHAADLSPGSFDLRISLPAELRGQSNATKIELVFSQQQNLPAPDDRPIAAKIDFLGLIED
jgi:hypothetical protein